MTCLQMIVAKCHSCGMLVAEVPGCNCPSCCKPFWPEDQIGKQSGGKEANRPDLLPASEVVIASARPYDSESGSKGYVAEPVAKQSTNSKETLFLGVFLIVLASIDFGCLWYLRVDLTLLARLVVESETLVKGTLGFLACCRLRWVPKCVFWLSSFVFISEVLFLGTLLLKSGFGHDKLLILAPAILYCMLQIFAIRQAWSIISRPWND